MQEKFSIFIPIEIEKGTGEGEDRYANMKFKGIASNPNFGKDKQGQWLDPKGFDLNDFLKAGTMNWHHRWKDKPTAIVGQPTKARITDKNELYVEGMLYKSSQIARDIYDLAEIMEKDSPDRRIGMSIEGIPTAVDKKDPNKILKARITNIALTPSPICPGTIMELMKGGLDDLEFNNNEQEFLIDITEDNIRYTVDQNLTINKAMVAGAITGRDTTDESTTQEALKEESVEGKKKKKKDSSKLLENLSERKGENFSKSEVFMALVSEHELDNESCKRVWELAKAIEKNSTI